MTKPPLSTPARSPGPPKGSGGRPKTGRGITCKLAFPPHVVEWIKSNREALYALADEWVKTQPKELH